MWPHYSGAPGARGPRFIEPPEPPVPTPLSMMMLTTVHRFKSLEQIYETTFNDGQTARVTVEEKVISRTCRDHGALFPRG